MYKRFRSDCLSYDRRIGIDRDELQYTVETSRSLERLSYDLEKWIFSLPFIVRLIIEGTCKRQTQNPSKSLKKPLFTQKDDNTPHVR